jgi:hypothetical protein
MVFRKGARAMDIKKGLIKMQYPEQVKDKFSDETYRFDGITGENLETILMAFFVTVGAFPFVRDKQIEFSNWACLNCSIHRFTTCQKVFGSVECFNSFLPNYFGAEHDWLGDFLTALKRRL